MKEYDWGTTSKESFLSYIECIEKQLDAKIAIDGPLHPYLEDKIIEIFEDVVNQGTKEYLHQVLVELEPQLKSTEELVAWIRYRIKKKSNRKLIN